MSRFRNALSALLFSALAMPVLAQDGFPGIGRDATSKEVAAWDIDVRPDFQGLPKGSGSVDDGQDVWEDRCAVCHGIFGESNLIFTPLVGGTTADDVKTGQVANLKRDDYPGRTAMMVVPTVSTLWDYIHRAMPWDNPKSLTPDEVFAVTAFLLNLANVLPDDFVLSDENIAEVQERMPNRNGMTLAHNMWPGDSDFEGMLKTSDVKNEACMTDCGPEPEIVSMLPDHARDAHGNLREQNRTVGPQRGHDTSKPEGKLGDAAGPVNIVAPERGGVQNAAVLDMLQQHACTACHNVDSKLVGPSFVDVAKKYPGQTEYLADKIKSGGVGVWGEVPMLAQDHVPAEDVQTLAQWLADGAAK